MAGKPPVCSRCANRAVILDRKSGGHLCRDHLMASVRERVLQYIHDIGTFPEVLGVAFSGGKDSSALIAVLAALAGDLPFRVVALTVDEGICGYREETIRAAEEIAAKYGVPHRIISFRQLFGESLDEIIRNRQDRACTVCGILRRRALEILARDEGIRMIATGHNLDDMAQTAVMNAISGDVKKVFAGRGISDRYAPRIKPFSRVTEREVTIYAFSAGVYHSLPECPYAGFSLRGEVRHHLNTYEREHPGTMMNAAKTEEDLRAAFGDVFSSGKQQDCESCGWPASSSICQVCMITGTGKPPREP